MKYASSGFTLAEALVGLAVGSFVLIGTSHLLLSIVSQAAQTDERLDVTDTWSEIERDLNSIRGALPCKQVFKTVSSGVESDFTLSANVWADSKLPNDDYSTINRIYAGRADGLTEGQRVGKSWVVKEISWRPMLVGAAGSEKPFKVELGSNLIQFRGHLSVLFVRDKQLSMKRVFSTPLGITVIKNTSDVIDCATKVVNPVVTAVGSRWALVLGGGSIASEEQNNRCDNVHPRPAQLLRRDLANKPQSFYKQWCDCFGNKTFDTGNGLIADESCQKTLPSGSSQCSSAGAQIYTIDWYFPARRSESRSKQIDPLAQTDDPPVDFLVTDELRASEGRCVLKTFSTSSGSFAPTDVLSFPKNYDKGRMNMGCKEGWFITSCTSASNGMGNDITVERRFESDDVANDVSKTGEYCSVRVKPAAGEEYVSLTVSCGRSQ
jgi:hypothetical protein